MFLQNDGSKMHIDKKKKINCNICKCKGIPIVKFKTAGKIKFKKFWKVVEDGVNDHRDGKVSCLVFVPVKQKLTLKVW